MSKTTAYMTGKDILLLPDGATYHLGVKSGEMADRIITVGSKSRAEAMSKLMDKVEHSIASSRMMYTYTGMYKGVRVSVVAIGMGAPMMDFFVREASFVCPGPMAIIRVGTCGLFNPDLIPGTAVTAGKGCTVTYINHAAFTNGLVDGTKVSPGHKYHTSAPVQGDKELNDLLLKNLVRDGVNAVDGLNNASDTFYSCQGRQDTHFDNGDNANIFADFKTHKFDSCEMETFTLMQLGRQRTVAPLKTAAVHIGILNRVNDSMTSNIGAEELHDLEVKCARAAFDALIAVKL